jgi:hypothetical protein
MLQVVCLIAEKTSVTVSGDPDLVKLLASSDVNVLADQLTREMATVDEAEPSPRIRRSRGERAMWSPRYQS